MATFSGTPRLDVNLNVNTNKATVKATGKIKFNESDKRFMKDGLIITVKGTLFGIDSGLKGGNDTLLSLGGSNFTGTQPDEVSYELARTNVLGKTLNEDTGFDSKDELRADLVIVNSLNPSSSIDQSSSNQVTGTFKS